MKVPYSRGEERDGHEDGYGKGNSKELVGVFVIGMTNYCASD